MMNNELKAKVSEELKAQGINASDAQIEAAIAQVTSKQELTEDTMENVAGGGLNPATIIKNAPKVIEAVKNIIGGGKKEEGGKGGGTNFSNTNDGGKQMSNQGTGNSNSNSGPMNW